MTTHSPAADERARRNRGDPTLDFDDGTPYDHYVGTTTLHNLQQPRTSHPDEMSFLVATQVMELLFGLLRFDWRTAQDELRSDRVAQATRILRRSTGHLRALNGVWPSLTWMTPTEFSAFRDELGEASGFQSAMYRHVEFLLGLKSEALIRPHQSNQPMHRELRAALAAPSLYDDVLALLARAGYPISPSVVQRNFSREYEPSAEVEAAWASVYREDPPGGEFFELAETLTDIAEEFTTWRHHHLMAARRLIGAKEGTGGSAGVRWLEQSLTRQVFPELWSARSRL